MSLRQAHRCCWWLEHVGELASPKVSSRGGAPYDPAGPRGDARGPSAARARARCRAPRTAGRAPTAASAPAPRAQVEGLCALVSGVEDLVGAAERECGRMQARPRMATPPSGHPRQEAAPSPEPALTPVCSGRSL